MWKAFSALKIKGEFKPRVDNLVFRLHYRYTFILFMAGAILSTLYDFVGEKIICMIETGDEALQKVVQSYCYITGTYTVDKLHYGEVGVDMPHPGVGPHTADDAVTYHTYYQWVPFVLVAQGAMFYLPHLIWKHWEGGLFRSIIQNLSVVDFLSAGKTGTIGNYFNRENEFKSLAVYITDSLHTHKGWSSKFIFCEFLNLIVTISTIFFTNFFLGGEFLTYGVKVIAMTNMDPENRTDPMSEIFPTMGKCSFRMYGPSGTIEKRDIMCLLPTNIANEKVYVMLWFWLVIVAVISSLWLILRSLSFIRPIREKVFTLRAFNFPRHNMKSFEPLLGNLATRQDVEIVLNDSDFGDYILLSQLADNMDLAMFSEFVRYLAKHIREERRTSSNDSGVHDDDDISKLKRKEAEIHEHPYLSAKA
ncbi:innexin inx2 [Hyalella azteca]|uniref:Innexin n=1 Tax=Hyalella azteca TaxID=294128 RepID=A0A8B7P9G6_HYAAZ|nr:innexin inx2 [Hyalella azteca]